MNEKTLTIQQDEEECFVIHKGKKYRKLWCNTCGCYSIDCPECKNSSCNGGGCSSCDEAFREYVCFMNNFKNKELKKHYADTHIEFVKDSYKETEELIKECGPEGTLVERSRILKGIMEDKND